MFVILFFLAALLVIVVGVDIGHTLTLSWSRSGESISQSVTVEAAGEHNCNVTVPAATTDKRADIAIDVSEMKSLYIHSDQNVVIETNNATTPANTLIIAANKPLIWFIGCGLTNPLTADVTAIFITNAGTSPANVRIRVLEDATT
jgi:hypothetical protein